MCHRVRHDQPVLAGEGAVLPDHAAVQHIKHMAEICRGREYFADLVIEAWITRDQHPVATIEDERATAGQRQFGIVLLEVADLDRAHHEAEQTPVGALEPAAEIDLPLAGDQAP